MNLGERYNNGYGVISPRKCYKGGQETNCRINNLILQNFKNKSSIDLYFYETDERINIESKLIKEYDPEWNKDEGKKRLNSAKKINKIKAEIKNSDLIKKDIKIGKYYPLMQYLKNCQEQIKILKLEEIEKILGFKLPPSAHNHGAWWANGGHSHSNA